MQGKWDDDEFWVQTQDLRTEINRLKADLVTLSFTNDKKGFPFPLNYTSL